MYISNLAINYESFCIYLTIQNFFSCSRDNQLSNVMKGLLEEVKGSLSDKLSRKSNVWNKDLQR